MHCLESSATVSIIYCYSIAVTTIGVALSAVLLDIAPLFTLLFSVLFFQEKVTFLKGIAVIINIIGCILTVTNGKLEIQSLALFGLLMGAVPDFYMHLPQSSEELQPRIRIHLS